MISEKVDLKYVIKLLRTAQKAVINVQQHPDHNDTFDIITTERITDADQPDPLRIPEVLIVVSVLLLWCGSIFIFIRHSELLRIRHRDLPFRSTIKPPASPITNLNHINIMNRSSDMTIQTKSRVSSAGGITPPVNQKPFQNFRQTDLIETISLTIPSSVNTRRHTRSFDFNISTLLKNQSDKHNDNEYLLHPDRTSIDIKKSFLQLQRKNFDNLSSIKYSRFHSANDMSRQRPNDATPPFKNKRCISESPV